MTILISGAAGNLGSFLARHLLRGPHALRLLVHRRPLAADIAAASNVSVYQADLDDPRTLAVPCRGADCIVHVAGVLFAPRPERFLPRTNVGYVRNLAAAALDAGVRRWILISFPHVEGESTPQRPATGRPDGAPASVHARTRLAAEKHLFAACQGTQMAPVVLRSGTLYGRGVLMIEAARWLLRRRLLAVWTHPTWYHMLSLPDFLSCVQAAIEREGISGIYNLGDDAPMLLQDVLDEMALHWGYRRPWRLPRWTFFAAGGACELLATLFQTASPLTRDFIEIGMVSHTSDTARMKRDLLPHLAYPSLREGLSLL
ncbi:MAG: NAD-dependent epimerase/dehydratase family protein [Armatimonadota bacterium]